VTPTGHLLYDVSQATEGLLVKGEAAIPFRTRNREWVVLCESIRLGEQVFALFHVDLQPIAHQ
jgi:hypothetical protein